MAKKNFSGTGLGSIAEEKPAHKRTLLDEINAGKPSTLKRHTFLINDTILEKLKDYVYTVKIGGNLLFTQQECLEIAISEYLEDKKITPRPDEYRDKFNKR